MNSWAQKKLCGLIFISMDPEQGEGDKRGKEKIFVASFLCFSPLCMFPHPSAYHSSLPSVGNSPLQVPESSTEALDLIGIDHSHPLNLWLYESMMGRSAKPVFLPVCSSSRVVLKRRDALPNHLFTSPGRSWRSSVRGDVVLCGHLSRTAPWPSDMNHFPSSYHQHYLQGTN